MKKNIIKSISRIIWVIDFIVLFIFLYFIYNANVIPTKYFIIINVIFLLLLLIYGCFVFKKKTETWILIILDLISLIFISGEVFATLKINEIVSFLNDNLNSKYETLVYDVVVNVKSDYNSIEDIEGNTVYTYKDLDDFSSIVDKLNEKVDVTLEYVDDVVELLDSINDDTEKIILVNSGELDSMIENDKDYESNIKILDTITVEVEKENISEEVDVTKDSFVVFLSGIDTRSGKLPSRSLSDVNIIIAVNPTTKKILMVHIPRDYYVQIHGTTGLKDKLTHTGTKGGINLTMQTIEDLFEIDIPYYVRVNFNSVVNLVDAIGGITITSDVDYSFTCWTDTSCTFKPGSNTVNGKCALAFARERHAYTSGDRHRGENQEQVISLIINKISSSKTLISNYKEILNALDGTFETNFTTKDITSLVKMQLEDMSSWEIDTYNVDGTGASKYTYSYPNQKLYVMEPDMETVESAIEKLDEVLGTN